MLDREAIDNRIRIIRRYRLILEDFKESPLEIFTEEFGLEFNAILRYLQVAIQACIDIAKHIIAAKNFEGPKDDLKEVFLILAKHKVLPEALAERLAKATGMRNVIVHSYVQIDPKLIHDAVQNNLTDFDKFVVAIGEYLEREKD